MIRIDNYIVEIFTVHKGLRLPFRTGGPKTYNLPGYPGKKKNQLIRTMRQRGRSFRWYYFVFRGARYWVMRIKVERMLLVEDKSKSSCFEVRA